MKIITTDTATSASADSTLTGYPASNVLDGHPKRQWKAAADATTATLTLNATGVTSGIAIFNIDADSIELEITDLNVVEWETGVTEWKTVETVWGSIDSDYPMVIHEFEYQNHKAVWFEFDEINPFGVDFNVIVNVDEAADDLGIGLVQLGKVEQFADPARGLNEGIHNYSIIKELSNGATYIKQRDIVRTFNGTVYLERCTAFYDFMASFARLRGSLPSAWRLTNADDFNWVVFARFTTPPGASHNLLIHSEVNFNIIEVL